MEQKFISAKEAAKLLGLSRSTIDRNVRAGLMPSYLVGDRRLFDPEELVEWVKSHRNDKPKKPAKSKSEKKRGK